MQVLLECVYLIVAFLKLTKTWVIMILFGTELLLNTNMLDRLFLILVFVDVLHLSKCIECSGVREENGCETNEYGNVTVCSGGLYEIDEIRSTELSALLLCSWPKESFDPTILSIFSRMKNFTLFRSHVKRFAVDFSTLPQLKILNISWNNIEFLSYSVFSKLTSLVLLDLRSNKLHYFNYKHVVDLPNFRKLYLSDNQWKCDRNLLWIVGANCSVCEKVIDLDLMKCNEDMYKNKPVKFVMSIIHTLNNECLRILDHCSCVLDHVVRFENSWRPMITVNCSYQNLSILPRPLPQFTSTLVMSGNKISDLSPFASDDRYLNILNAYLDDNNISSINVLEDSSWLLTFRALSLRENYLSEVQVYVLESALEKNPNVGNLWLSMNPWKCDCIFTPVFQTFLAKYRAVIKDVENIRYSEYKNDDKSLHPITSIYVSVITFVKPNYYKMKFLLLQILSLSRNKICGETAKISIWNIINLCLVILLIVLLCDFLYNYYMYKKYSKLPWIASKLP